MDLQLLADTIAIPLGVAVFVITELAKMAGVKNEKVIRLTVICGSFLLALLASYATNWFEVVSNFIFVLGSALTAYHMVWKPLTKKDEQN